MLALYERGERDGMEAREKNEICLYPGYIQINLNIMYLEQISSNLDVCISKYMYLNSQDSIKFCKIILFVYTSPLQTPGPTTMGLLRNHQSYTILCFWASGPYQIAEPPTTNYQQPPPPPPSPLPPPTT